MSWHKISKIKYFNAGLLETSNYHESYETLSTKKNKLIKQKKQEFSAPSFIKVALFFSNSLEFENPQVGAKEFLSLEFF